MMPLRWLFRFAWRMSLLLLIAVVVIWIRSARVCDWADYSSHDHSSVTHNPMRDIGIESWRGELRFRHDKQSFAERSGQVEVVEPGNTDFFVSSDRQSGGFRLDLPEGIGQPKFGFLIGSCRRSVSVADEHLVGTFNLQHSVVAAPHWACAALLALLPAVAAVRSIRATRRSSARRAGTPVSFTGRLMHAVWVEVSRDLVVLSSLLVVLLTIAWTRSFWGTPWIVCQTDAGSLMPAGAKVSRVCFLAFPSQCVNVDAEIDTPVLTRGAFIERGNPSAWFIWNTAFKGPSPAVQSWGQPPTTFLGFSLQREVRTRTAQYGNNVVVPIMQEARYHASAPTCLVVLLTGLAPLVGVRNALRRRRARTRATKGLCPACGYDCRASVGRCPECGTPRAA